MDDLTWFRFGPMQKYLMPKSRETYLEPKMLHGCEEHLGFDVHCSGYCR